MTLPLRACNLRRRFAVAWQLVVLLALLLLRGELMADTRSVVHAPEFPPGLSWLNTAAPLRLADLRGKVVLLDFWTYCCINCIHIIPELTALEHKYPNELVVIGVHSAKFYHEKDTANIRQAILRYEIQHPVVNDHDFRIWRSYAVRAWPTLIVIKPDGYVLGYFSGEGHQAALEQLIDTLIQEARSCGILQDKPCSWRLEKMLQPPTLLSFPGKVLAHAPSGRLFIADSNHNRIIIATLAGNVLAIAGHGARGHLDGDFATATFHHPQGLALVDDLLYVADTDNHIIRCLDLHTHTVTTVAGTGKQARQWNVSGTGTQVALNSPWDLQYLDKQLFIAMAGFHQVWRMHLETSDLAPYAGSGREDLIDGPRLQAAMAQPSGLGSDGTQLYVADSETSAIRSVSLGINGVVNTIVGEGLFDFGDQDGTGLPQVRLQHPLGVAYHDGYLYVADTYNHKIKTIALTTATTTTYLGNGTSGMNDGQEATFCEPSGLSVAAGKLYIADTNNHAIRVADLATATVTTLALRRLAMPAAISGFARTSFADDDVIQVLAQHVQAGTPGQFLIDLQFPSGYHLNPKAPLQYSIAVVGEGLNIAAQDRTAQLVDPSLPLIIPFHTAPSSHEATVDIDMTFYYCRQDDTGVCVIQSVHWQMPLHISTQTSTTTAKISYKAEAPEIQKPF